MHRSEKTEQSWKYNTANRERAASRDDAFVYQKNRSDTSGTSATSAQERFKFP